jgi:hypothetical protein
VWLAGTEVNWIKHNLKKKKLIVNCYERIFSMYNV